MTIRVLPQPPEDEDNENSNSLGLRIQYKEFPVLTTDDSEHPERAKWHNNAAADLLSDYGHPHQATLNLLKKNQIPVKRTDTDGSITVTSDGKDFKVN